jgi:hypothetical protein
MSKATEIVSIKKREVLNSDGQQFNQYQQNKQSTLTSDNLPSG